MGKSSPSPPPPPDPVATAQAQGAVNREAAIASSELGMVNQYTPYGTLEFDQRGTSGAGTPQYSATQTLAPDQQQMLDLSNQAGIAYGETANQQLDAVRGRLADPLDYTSLGPRAMPNEAYRDEIAASMTARLQPQRERERDALETRLANQGITLGSDAWRMGQDDYSRFLTDQDLAIDAAAGNEMSRMYGLESAGRDQAINEMVQQRQIPINELSAMLSGTQVQGPQFVNTPAAQVAPADLIGATYGSANLANQNYQSQLAADNASRSGLYSLLGAGAMGAGMMFGGPQTPWFLA